MLQTLPYCLRERYCGLIILFPRLFCAHELPGFMHVMNRKPWSPFPQANTKTVIKVYSRFGSVQELQLPDLTYRKKNVSGAFLTRLVSLSTRPPNRRDVSISEWHKPNREYRRLHEADRQESTTSSFLPFTPVVARNSRSSQSQNRRINNQRKKKKIR